MGLGHFGGTQGTFCGANLDLIPFKKAATLPTISAMVLLQNTGEIQMAISQLYNWGIFEHKVCFCDTKSSTIPVIFQHGDKLRYLQSKYYERG